jgi:GrpB-like predicted nucleotidyltransferase (UPF0157 family)
VNEIIKDKRKLEVIPYDPEWEKIYQIEKKKLISIFENELVKIHHIGSTAIPNCAAKPTIDILIECKDINQIEKYIEVMVREGYQFKGEQGIPGRQYFRKGVPNHTHHVHIYQNNDLNINRHLAFRDYLLSRPELIKKYSKIKIALVKEDCYDVDKYIDGKNDIVKRIEQQALYWQSCK